MFVYSNKIKRIRLPTGLDKIIKTANNKDEKYLLNGERQEVVFSPLEQMKANPRPPGFS